MSAPCAPCVHAALIARREMFQQHGHGVTNVATMWVFPNTETVFVPGHPLQFQRVWLQGGLALFVEEGAA